MTVATRDNSHQLSYRKKNPSTTFNSSSTSLIKGFTTLFNTLHQPENKTGDRVLDELPVDLRQKVLGQLERDYQDFHVKPGSTAWKQRRHDYVEALQTYFDARFQVSTGRRTYRFKNKEWTKHFLRDALRTSLARGGNPKKLEHIVRCTVDINGLKSINDLSSKVKGDEFLNYVAHLLYDLVKNNIVTQYGQKSMRFALVSEGGDEFAIYLELPRPARERDINYIYQTISQGLCFDCSEFLPNNTIVRRGGIFIPSSLQYKFYSSAGVSVESLNALLLNKKTYEETKKMVKAYLEENMSCDIEHILASAILNRADELTEKDKELYKYKLARSKQPGDAITYQILMRNKEMIRLYKENQALAEQMERLVRELEDQKARKPSLINDLSALLGGSTTPLFLKKKIVR